MAQNGPYIAISTGCNGCQHVSIERGRDSRDDWERRTCNYSGQPESLGTHFGCGHLEAPKSCPLLADSKRRKALQMLAEVGDLDLDRLKSLLAASPDDYWDKIVGETKAAGTEVRHAHLLNHEAAHLLAWGAAMRDLIAKAGA